MAIEPGPPIYVIENEISGKWVPLVALGTRSIKSAHETLLRLREEFPEANYRIAAYAFVLAVPEIPSHVQPSAIEKKEGE